MGKYSYFQDDTKTTTTDKGKYSWFSSSRKEEEKKSIDMFQPVSDSKINFRDYVNPYAQFDVSPTKRPMWKPTVKEPSAIEKVGQSIAGGQLLFAKGFNKFSQYLYNVGKKLLTSDTMTDVQGQKTKVPSILKKDSKVDKFFTNYFTETGDWLKKEYGKTVTKRTIGSSKIENDIYTIIEATSAMTPAIMIALATGGATAPTMGTIQGGGLTGVTMASQNLPKVTLVAKQFASSMKRTIPFGVQAAGNYIDEALDKGIPYHKAAPLGIINGMFEMMTETVPFEMSLRLLSKTQTNKLIKIGFRKFLTDRVFQTAQTGGSQALQELVMNPITEFTESAVTGRALPKTFGEGGVFDPQVALESGKTALGMTILLSLFGLPSAGIINYRRNNLIKSYNALEDFKATPEGKALVEKLLKEEGVETEQIGKEPTTQATMQAVEKAETPTETVQEKQPYEKTKEEYRTTNTIPEMNEPLPEKGTYPAIEMEDGSIFVDKKKSPSTHVEFIKENNLPAERIKSGGWVVDGVYEPTSRSDTVKYSKQIIAEKNTEHKRAVKKAIDEGKSVPQNVLEEYPNLITTETVTEKETAKLQENIKELTKYEQMLKDNPETFGGLVSPSQGKAFSDFIDVKLKKYRRLLEQMGKKKMTKFAIKEVRELIKKKESIKTLKAEFKAKERARIEKDKVKRAEKKQREAENKLLKSMQKLSTAKMRPEFEKSAKELLKGYDLKSKSLTQKNKLKLTDLRNEVESFQKEDSAYVVPQDVLDKIKRLNNKFIKNMTPKEVQELQDLVDHIVNENKNAGKLLGEERAYDGNEAVKQSLKDIGDSDLVEIKEVNDYTKLLGNFIAAFGKWEVLQPERVVASTVGWNFDSPFVKWTYGTLNKGQKKSLNFLRDSTKYIEKGLKGVKAKDYNRTKVYNFENGDMTLKRGEALAIYMHSLNKDNARHITEGGARPENRTKTMKLTESDFNQIKDSLTKTDKKVIATAQHFFEVLAKDAINETSLDVLGYYLARVTNYFPIVTDKMFENADLNKFLGGTIIEGFSFLKERANAENPIMLLNIFDVMERAKIDVAKYYGFARPLRNAKMMLGNSRISQAIKAKYGHEKPITIMRTLMKDIEQNKPLKSETEKTFDWLIGNYQRAILGFNPGIMVKQIASLPTASAVLDPKYFLPSLKRKTSKDIKEQYSSLVWFRDQGFITKETGEAQKLTKIGHKPSWYTAGIRLVDRAAIDRIWSWAEEQTAQTTSMKEGSSEFYNAVAELTELAIYRTQPNYTLMQRPELSRTKSQFVRLLTMFTTQRFQNYGLLYQGVAEVKSGKIKKGAKAISSVLAGSIVFALINSRLRKWRGYDEDLAGEYVKSLVGNVAFAGAIYNTLIDGFSNKNILDQGLSDILNSGRSLLSGMGTDKTIPSKIRRIVESLAQFGGVPVKNTIREFETLLINIDPYLAHEWELIWDKTPEYKFSPEATKIKEDYSKINRKYESAKEKGTLTSELVAENSKYKLANKQLNNYRSNLEKLFGLNISIESKKKMVEAQQKQIEKLIERFD